MWELHFISFNCWNHVKLEHIKHIFKWNMNYFLSTRSRLVWVQGMQLHQQFSRSITRTQMNPQVWIHFIWIPKFLKKSIKKSWKWFRKQIKHIVKFSSVFQNKNKWEPLLLWMSLHCHRISFTEVMEQGHRNRLKSRGARFTNLSVFQDIDGCILGLPQKSRGAIVPLAPL